MSAYVTSSFRVQLLGRYPGLSKNPAYWRLLLYLISGGQTDDETGNTVIPAALLADFEGLRTQYAARNYVAETFLEAFKRDVLAGLEYSDWSLNQLRARTVTNHGLAPEVREWFDQMQLDLASGTGDVVDAPTGLKWDRRRRARDATTDSRRIDTLLEAHEVSTPAREVIDYHNRLPSNLFTSVVTANLLEAIELGASLENVAARRQTLGNIAQIRLHPKPLLRPVENSSRPFSLRPSLLTVKSEVRRIFTRRWVDYDLSSAQLAIVARDWGVAELEAFLATGTSVWEHLTDAIGVPLDMKPTLKTAVYSLVFGASKRAIRQLLDDEQQGLGDAFLNVDLVKSVYAAREVRIAELLEARFGTTALGRRIEIPYGDWSERAGLARKILAQQAQALELLLIHPVYQLASETGQFRIALYQFDGITVAYRDYRNASHWHRRIVEAVSSAAKAFGIQTRFEHEPGSDFSKPL